MSTITATSSALIHAELAAIASMKRNEGLMGAALGWQIARGHDPFVSPWVRDLALAAWADDLEAQQLSREYWAMTWAAS